MAGWLANAFLYHLLCTCSEFVWTSRPGMRAAQHCSHRTTHERPPVVPLSTPFPTRPTIGLISLAALPRAPPSGAGPHVFAAAPACTAAACLALTVVTLNAESVSRCGYARWSPTECPTLGVSLIDVDRINGLVRVSLARIIAGACLDVLLNKTALRLCGAGAGGRAGCGPRVPPFLPLSLYAWRRPLCGASPHASPSPNTSLAQLLL